MPPVATDRPAPVAGHEAGECASSRCRNCGADAPGNYCPDCGQETSLALPTAGAFLREAAGRYVTLDGRMWRSLRLLMFRPGFLTREYLAGRRRRYVRPARLFVALSIVFFAVLRFTAGPPTVIVLGSERTDPEAIAGEAGASTGELGIRVDPDLNVSLGVGSWSRLAPLRRRVDAFNRLSRQQKSEQITAGVLRYAPYAAIGLLPLFALLLRILYAGGRQRHPARPRRYAAHLVFGAHNHAFLFLAATAMALLDFRPLRLALVLWMIVYAPASMKAVYGGSWIGVVLRALALALVYSMFFGVAVAALLLAAVMLR